MKKINSRTCFELQVAEVLWPSCVELKIVFTPVRMCTLYTIGDVCMGICPLQLVFENFVH